MSRKNKEFYFDNFFIKYFLFYMEMKDIIKSIKKLINNTYSPYSKLPVAAILETKDGKLYKGVNIENSSFGLTICAERVAIFNAVTFGEKNFKRIFIYAPTKTLTYPCGACLQVMYEFSKNLVIILVNDFEYKILNIMDLLPFGFNL